MCGLQERLQQEPGAVSGEGARWPGWPVGVGTWEEEGQAGETQVPTAAPPPLGWRGQSAAPWQPGRTRRPWAA